MWYIAGLGHSGSGTQWKWNRIGLDLNENLSQ